MKQIKLLKKNNLWSRTQYINHKKMMPIRIKLNKKANRSMNKMIWRIVWIKVNSIKLKIKLIRKKKIK